MGHETLLDLCKTTLLTALLICAPALLVGMAVGLLVSFFQTVTSLQEQTLTFVPKLVAVTVTLVATAPWIGGQLVRFTRLVFEGFPGALR